MTNTLPSKNGTKPRPKRNGKESAVGKQKHKRTAIDVGLALITPIVGQEFLDRYNLRDPLNRSLKYGVKQAFSAAGASTRQFKRIKGLGKAPTRLKASGADYFDLIPEDVDGIAAHRSTVTNALVAESLAYGDMGLALPILAPGGVASALTHWGSADQQATYLKDFAGDSVPQACVAI